MSQFINNKYTSIEQVAGQFLANKNKTTGKINEKTSSFEEVLLSTQSAKETTELKFSKHANERLVSRNIDLSESQYRRLESGARKASEKGMRESLVMVDNLAFIVNVNNKTVVTAVSGEEERVFTNIDGAVIM
ncbi:TIGR02530 family flagellar biosynthesis protein [Clostridium sp. Marseille-P299]|uniref:TIGR02530 family flagellar biosynthesis protein n=1 Tax=Clostridium sp. Marseille-P299 TaxID=1805477 RepID=UPI000831E4EF|nr:TIGR02530 family flagellar biosynthesis protein [Clostridium sp. Marseille-P299]